MNKLTFKIGMLSVICGMIPGTIWAVSPEQIQVPSFLQSGVEVSQQAIIPMGELTMNYKVVVTRKLDKWMDSLDKAIDRVENNDQLSTGEKRVIKEVIEKERKDIYNLKKSVTQSQDFEESDANSLYDAMDERFVKVQNKIHKVIKETRIDHQQATLDELKALSNKMKVYIDMANTNGLNTKKAAIELTEMNAQLSTASDKLGDAESRIDNVTEDVALNTSYRHFQKCDNDLKNVKQSLKNAKSLGEDVLKELRRAIKNQ